MRRVREPQFWFARRRDAVSAKWREHRVESAPLRPILANGLLAKNTSLPVLLLLIQVLAETGHNKKQSGAARPRAFANLPTNIPNLNVTGLAQQRHSGLYGSGVIFAFNPVNALDDVEFVHGEEAIGGHCPDMDLVSHLGCHLPHNAILPGDLRHQ